MKIITPAVLLIIFSVAANAQSGSHVSDPPDYTIVYPPDYLKTTKFIYGAVEEGAEFPGGKEKFNEYISKNLRWPKNQFDIQGRVIVTFVIERNGKLTGIKIARGLHDAFDKAALKLIHKSGRWIPGRIKGEPVRTQYAVPIPFIKENN